MSKFAKKFLRLFIIYTSCLFSVLKSSEIEAFRVAHDASLPSLLLLRRFKNIFDTHEAAFVVAWTFFVGGISRVSRAAKIKFAIVERIAVSVISNSSFRSSEDEPMHPYFVKSSISTGIVGLGIRRPLGIPEKLRNSLKIVGIDDRDLSLRKSYKSVGWVERLGYGVSYHTAFHRCTSNALRFSLYLIILALFAIPSFAQVTVAPMPFVVPQFFDSSGHACAGCKIGTFAAGTSTPLATYADPSGVFPNSQPVVLDSAGRARIYLTGASYKLVLSTAAGTQIWSVDQVAGSNNSILFSANNWVGVQTFQATTNFNGPANFNVGLTSLGPNVLNGGGTIAGTWSGSPGFSGTLGFNAGFTATTGIFSGQITSNVAGGTSPFVITSNTQVPNLNASLLEGCTWESPCAIGGTTPNTAHFTSVVMTGVMTLGGSNVSTIKGTASSLYTAGTIAGGAGHALCTDANGSATTSGCGALTTSVGQLGGASCTTGNSSFDTCTSVITISPAQPDTSYIPSCTGISPSDPRALIQTAFPTSTTTITATVITEGSVAVSFGNIGCTATHL